LIWHLRIESEAAERIFTRTERAFPAAPRAWATIESERSMLRAPLVPGTTGCEGCARGGCTLALQRGKLTFFDEDAPASYGGVLDALAPDPADIRIFRSRERNWSTLHALVHRLRAQGPPVDSFRFEAPESRGVVTRFDNRGVERFVIYPYDEAGLPGPVVALSGVEVEVFRQILGSLRLAGALEAGHSRCTL